MILVPAENPVMSLIKQLGLEYLWKFRISYNSLLLIREKRFPLAEAFLARRV
jgi:hypothetical protein